jgi:hypothetical protein
VGLMDENFKELPAENPRRIIVKCRRNITSSYKLERRLSAELGPVIYEDEMASEGDAPYMNLFDQLQLVDRFVE